MTARFVKLGGPPVDLLSGATPPTPPAAVTHGYQMNATNTGPIGAGLTYADLEPSGTVTTTTDGQVIEGLDILGNVRVRHNNVTVRNCRIDANLANAYCVDFATGTPVTGTLIEWCELTRANNSGTVYFSPYTIRRSSSHTHPADAMKAGSNCAIEECYIHSLYTLADSHNDAIQIVSAPAGPVTVRRSRIEAQWQDQTAAIIAQSATDHIAGLTVEDNLLGGGSFALYTIVQDYAYSFGSPPEIHGNYYAGQDAVQAAENPANSWLFGHRQNDIVCNESGNFFAPLLDPVNHPTPWAVDLADLRPA